MSGVAMNGELLELGYDPKVELYTCVTSDVLADSSIRLSVIEHRGDIELVQWRMMPAGAAVGED